MVLHEIRDTRPSTKEVPSARPARPLDVAAVYRDHFDFVFRNLRRLGVPPAAIEDACHDVFVVVHRRADDWDRSCALRTWLYGVVRRVAADARRGSGRTRRRIAAMSAEAPTSPALPDDTLADRRLVQEFLDALDPEKRDVFILVELEEMTAREVAGSLGINPNTASARLRAARCIFAARLQVLAEHEREPRIVAAARRSDDDRGARARVWVALAPVFAGKVVGASGMVVAAIAAAIAVVTTASVVDATPPYASPPSSAVAPAAIASAEAAAEPTAVATLPPIAVARVPERATPTTPVATRKPRPEGDEPRGTSATGDLAAQTELAGKIMRATDPAAVLRDVEAYRQTFGAGFYGDRLSARRISALCELSRGDVARVEHARLAARQPAMADRALEACDARGHEADDVRPLER